MDLFTSYFNDIITKKICITIEDTSKDNEWIKYREKSLVKFNYISCAGAPLYTGNKVIGIIRLYSRTEKRIFTALEKEHIQLIGIQVAHAIENSKLFEQNEKQSPFSPDFGLECQFAIQRSGSPDFGLYG